MNNSGFESSFNRNEITKQQNETPLAMVLESTRRSIFDVSDEERVAAYEKLWHEGEGFGLYTYFTDMLSNKAANDTLADFVKDKIRARVSDPETAAKLTSM